MAAAPGTAPAFKTDVHQRSSLASGLLPTAAGRRADNAGQSQAEPTSEEYLARFEEDLQKKVDGDIGTLVDGLADCVALAKVDGKDKFKAAQDAVEMELKAESMVRATENLLSLSHTLKLMFLLHGEDTGSVRANEAQAARAANDYQAAKQRATDALQALLDKQFT